ncbi:MAG: PEGA domain-containing protein [Spirochaetaceae bacterium]|nr:PEGA domain-containing protein [Spirochaetaceae bacterium]
METPFQRKIIFIIISIILLFQGFYLSAADWATVIEKTGPGIAKITLTNGNGAIVSQGTGFAIADRNGNDILVTNAHVVKEAHYNESVLITIEFLHSSVSGRKYSGNIELIDSYLDLCTITMDNPAPFRLELADADQSELMSEVVAAGYPLGKNFKATPGYIQAFQTIEKMGNMLDLSSDLAPGNSGGPILDSQGVVIGIATAIIPGYNFNLAIPVKNLHSFLLGGSELYTFHISTTPSESRVFIDGTFKGKTPLSLDLFNKEYRIRLEKEGYTAFEEKVGPWGTTKTQEYSRSLEEIQDLNPQVTITSDREGAEVFVNNRFIGESPVTVQMAVGRIMRIRVKKGRREGSEIYTVTDLEEQKIHIILKR